MPLDDEFFRGKSFLFRLSVCLALAVVVAIFAGTIYFLRSTSS